MPQIIPNQDTWLKLSTRAAAELPAEQKRARSADDPLSIISVAPAPDQHWRIWFSPPGLTIGGRQRTSCLIWPEHWRGVGQVLTQVQALNLEYDLTHPAPITRPTRHLQRSSNGKIQAITLEIGYKSQRDNQLNPEGACNVTSVAMVLAYFGIDGNGSGQLEDQLYAEMDRRGLRRHSPHDLRRIAQDYGLKARFTTRATIAQVRRSLDSGRPCVLHGYFTNFGHIVVAVGYDAQGLIIHDPYGLYTPEGYQRNDAANPRRGEYVCYPYGLIERTCLPDGDFWVHFYDSALKLDVPVNQIYVEQAIAEPEAAIVETIAKPSTDTGKGVSTVKVIYETWLKSDWRKQAIALPTDHKARLVVGQSFECIVTQAKAGHVIVAAAQGQLFGRNYWFAFADHLEILTSGSDTSASIPGQALTNAEIKQAAKGLDISPRSLKALLTVEASGAGFLPSGRPKILFEAAWFGHFTQYQWNAAHPTLSTRDWDRSLYKAGEAEWSRLEAAMKLDKAAAYKSTSWGIAQIMGFNWRDLGYQSIDDFVEHMFKSEAHQLDAMCRFVKSKPPLHHALKRKDWSTVAFHYNGESYAINQYDIRLAKAYEIIPVAFH